jgi:hypothetical protein
MDEHAQGIESHKATKKARTFDVFLVPLLSIIGSAGASYLVMYGNVEKLGVKMDEHERRITISENQASSAATEVAALKAREDASDRFRSEVEDQLARIDAKLDRLIERRRNGE